MNLTVQVLNFLLLWEILGEDRARMAECTNRVLKGVSKHVLIFRVMFL